MNLKRTAQLALALALCFLLQQGGLSQDNNKSLRFRSNDMVVSVGNTFIERAQSYGYIETILALEAGRQKASDVRFRNLGWSGDTVWCDARSYFGPPQEGFDRLQKGIGELKPTIILSNYGGAEAMEKRAPGESEEQALKKFTEGYQRLIKMMIQAAGEGLREIVLISPTPLENMGAPLPDNSGNNKRLATYRDAIARLAQSYPQERVKIRFADLFAAMGGNDFTGEVSKNPLTTNGIHYTEKGYQVVAYKLANTLGWESPDAIKDKTALNKLRHAVIQKNRLFFHRWRPANETYLFLFRKHEQGQNAKEIPMFDPLVRTKEKEINYLQERVLESMSKH